MNSRSLIACLLLCGSLFGCSSTTTSGSETSAFVGTWKPTSGTETVTCGNQPASTSQITDNITWANSTTGSSIVLTSGTCNYTATVSGLTATAAPGQTCAQKDNQGNPITLTQNAFTFSLSADGKTATASGSGSAVDGATSCTYTQSGNFQKISN